MSRARVHDIDPLSPAGFIREALKNAKKQRGDLMDSHITRREVQSVLDDNKPMSPEFALRASIISDVSFYHLLRLQTNWLMKEIKDQRKWFRKILNTTSGCCCGSLDPETWEHFLPGDDRMDPHHIFSCPYVQAARALGFSTRHAVRQEEDEE